MKTLHDVGEFGLISQIAKDAPVERGVVKGIGDDAAVLDIGTEEYQLFTTDMLVEGIHFLRTMMSPSDIGHKALGCSISDIAAMGGIPTYAVVSLAAPSNISAKFIEGIAQGMNALAKAYGVSMVGGDTVRAMRIVINVALLGRVKKEEVVYRSGARKGDIIFVTGALGNSLKTQKHLQFRPRVAEARFAVTQAKPHAMMDVSDGLAGDLGHVLRESKVGAVIEEARIPLAKGASLQQALHDGEDFELVMTVPPERADALRHSKKFHFYEIGRIVSGKSLTLATKDGRKQFVAPKGFQHF